LFYETGETRSANEAAGLYFTASPVISTSSALRNTGCTDAPNSLAYIYSEPTGTCAQPSNKLTGTIGHLTVLAFCL
jgi:hypothetical protein